MMYIAPIHYKLTDCPPRVGFVLGKDHEYAKNTEHKKCVRITWLHLFVDSPPFLPCLMN